MKDYFMLDKQYILPTYPRRGLIFVRGQGVYLYDDKGKKYLDMMSNYGINILGYGNKTILKALHRQLDRLTNLHGSFANDVRSKAAQKIISFCPKHLSQLNFSNSGSEAVEAALKFAYLAKKSTHFIAMKNAYHGKTLGSLSATGSEKYKKDFMPLIWNFKHVKFGDIYAFKQSIRKKTGAVILELVQGESGVITTTKDYIKTVEKICLTKGILLIIDEIQTGCCRTGSFFAFEQFGIKPDIVCLGKGIAGGIPVGVTIVSREVALAVTRGSHTSTFGGNPMTAAGIIATLAYLKKEKLAARNKKMGAYFIKSLAKIKSSRIREVRGRGMMLAVELNEPPTPILKKMQDMGVLARPAGDNAIGFLPPYIVTKENIDRAVHALKLALEQ